jgi:hypothetical protein
MAQPDPIDVILAELRQELSDTLTMINIVVALRRNSAHLLQLLRSMMVDLCEHIEQVLPTLPPEGVNDTADQPRSPAEADHGTPIPPS